MQIKPKKGRGRVPTFRTRPDIQLKANIASRGKKRPNRMSKKKIEIKAKVEIVKEELLRQGYLKAVQEYMPAVLKAHFKVASNPKASATQERKLMFQSAGIMKDEGKEVAESIGQLLANIANQE